MLSVVLPFISQKIGAKGKQVEYAIVFPDHTGNVYRLGGSIPYEMNFAETRDQYIQTHGLVPVAKLVALNGLLHALPAYEGASLDIEATDKILSLLKKGYSPSYLIHMGFLSPEAGIAAVATFMVENGALPSQATQSAAKSYELHTRAVRSHAANQLRISDVYLRGGDTDPASLAPQSLPEQPSPFQSGMYQIDQDETVQALDHSQDEDDFSPTDSSLLGRMTKKELLEFATSFSELDGKVNKSMSNDQIRAVIADAIEAQQERDEIALERASDSV